MLAYKSLAYLAVLAVLSENSIRPGFASLRQNTLVRCHGIEGIDDALVFLNYLFGRFYRAETHPLHPMIGMAMTGSPSSAAGIPAQSRVR
jgi:hypothetical protein